MKLVPIGISCAVMFGMGTALAQQAAHEHGVAQIKLALDGETLLIELESPLDNLVGFESAPRTPEQQAALAEAESRLAQGGVLFVTETAAGCVLAEVQLESPFENHAQHDHDDHKHDDHKHDDHKHDDHKHDDHKHDDHKHDEHEHVSDQDGHADFYAVYQFSCANPSALKHIELGLFEVFPRLELIRATVVSPAGQRADNLERGASRLAL